MVSKLVCLIALNACDHEQRDPPTNRHVLTIRGQIEALWCLKKEIAIDIPISGLGNTIASPSGLFRSKSKLRALMEALDVLNVSSIGRSPQTPF